jgi:hypothetical protein
LESNTWISYLLPYFLTKQYDKPLKCGARKMLELTLRPSHLILDPDGNCLVRTTLKLEEETYSLILSVMFTMVPVFFWDFPAINDRRYQVTKVSMTTRMRVINERLIANKKNKKTESQETGNLNRSF